MAADGLAATEQALARHDWQAAFDHAQAAQPPTPELEAARADMLAEAAWWLGRLDECIEARELAYRSYDALGDSRSAGQCAVWLYEHNAIGGRPSIGGAWLRRAGRALEDDQVCTAYGTLLLRQAEAADGDGEYGVAADLASQVIDLGRELRSPDLEAEALQTMGRVLIDQGEIAEGMGHLDEAMLFAAEGRLGPYSAGKVYCSLISACEEVGDLDRAAEWTEATLRWAQQHPFAIFPGICRVHRAVVLKRRGDLAAAEREAVQAGQELASSHVGNSAAALAEVGDIRRRLGELDRAEEAFAQAEQICGHPCAELALLRLAQGRIETARSIIAACIRDAPVHGLVRARLLPISVQVAVAAGDEAGADADLTALEDLARDFATPLVLAGTAVTRGRVQLARGDAAGAQASLQLAVGQWEAMGVPYEVATARTLLGQACRECGDEDGAAAAFTAAAELFDHIGARADAQLVLGGSRRELPAGLTEREVEVLRLIAGGLTNNEIAAQLYLSTKTVSRHLSNIFTKIGVSSRSAATAFAFAHELVDPQPGGRPAGR